MENKEQHEQYEEWSLQQLKNELRQRKAKLSGRKKELVARLKFLDANVNVIVTEDEPAEEYFMPKPVKELYKDLHSDIPDVASLEMSHVKEYLQRFNKTIDDKSKALDHDYLQFSTEVHFMRENKLVNITAAEIDEVESRTRGQTRSSDWMTLRYQRLTSSNFGTICKATDRRSMLSLTNCILNYYELHTSAGSVVLFREGHVSAE